MHRSINSQIPPTRKEGWLRLVNQDPRAQPAHLDRGPLEALNRKDKAQYDNARYDWHSNFEPLRTPQLESVHEDLWDTVDSNRHDGDRVKSAAAIDALPGLGKSIIARTFGAEFHRREVDVQGEFTDQGNERLPVCYLSLTSNTTMKTLNQMFCDFYGHPGSQRGTAHEYARRALDCMLTCETQLIIVDDVHFVTMRHSEGLAVSNHFKWLANEFPATFVFVGVGLREKGFLSEGMTAGASAMAQTARRCARLSVDPFLIDSEDGRIRWRRLLLGLEQKMVLADSYRGMIADDLPDYLYERSSGHMVSLTNILLKGCARAIRSGAERLSEELLDKVQNDEGAEQSRQSIAAAIRNGKMSARPQGVEGAETPRGSRSLTRTR